MSNKKIKIMCKIKNALREGNFEALATMQFSTNDIESILTDAEEALRDDENLVEETEARTQALKLRIERAQKRINEKHMLNGISIVDPDTTYIGSDVVIGNDTTIYPNTFLYGHSIVGTNCNIGPNSYIVDSIIDNDVSTKNSVIEAQTLRKTN